MKIIELKNFFQCQFDSLKSAYSYLLMYSRHDPEYVNMDTFTEAIKFLLPHKLSLSEIKDLYSSLLETPNDFQRGFNYRMFVNEMGHLQFKGR